MNVKENQDNSRRPPPEYISPPYVYQQDDEVDWAELLNILRARMRQIITIFLIVMLMGSVYAWLKQDIYAYTTAVQIGATVEDGKEKIIDEVKNVESELREIYIPAVLGEFYKKNPETPKNIKIDVTVPKDSYIVVLTGKSSIASSSPYLDLLEKAGNALIRKHNEEIAAQRDIIIEEIAKAKDRIKILMQNGKTVAERVSEFDKNLGRMGGEHSATAALVVTELAGQQLQIENQIYTLETLIAKRESWLPDIKESKFLMPVTKSNEPVGLGKKSVILFSALAGVILAILTAFMTEFYTKITLRLAQTDENGKP